MHRGKKDKYESRIYVAPREIDGGIYEHICLRCGYRWISRKREPKTCASKKCRSPYYYISRKREEASAEAILVGRFKGDPLSKTVSVTFHALQRQLELLHEAALSDDASEELEKVGLDLADVEILMGFLSEYGDKVPKL